MQFISDNERQTIQAGRVLAKFLKSGDIICLHGGLGTGKTVFARGVSFGLNVTGSGVTSPTFVLMRCHRGRLPMYHFDFYRIDGPGELLGLGCEDFLFSDGVCVIEWAQRLGFLAPGEYLKVELEHVVSLRSPRSKRMDRGAPLRRRLRLTARGRRYRELLADFSREYEKTKMRRVGR
jgi:tRNA threonylcarbamoyladenosine biosynthesis protein TsaE